MPVGADTGARMRVPVKMHACTHAQMRTYIQQRTQNVGIGREEEQTKRLDFGGGPSRT